MFRKGEKDDVVVGKGEWFFVWEAWVVSFLRVRRHQYYYKEDTIKYVKSLKSTLKRFFQESFPKDLGYEKKNGFQKIPHMCSDKTPWGFHTSILAGSHLPAEFSRPLDPHHPAHQKYPCPLGPTRWSLSLWVKRLGWICQKTGAPEKKT